MIFTLVFLLELVGDEFKHLAVQLREKMNRKGGKKFDPKKIMNMVKKLGKKFGFVLNPETSIEELSSYKNDLDQVLIMTVNPGFYGSPFLPEMLEKIRKLRAMKPTLDIEVDGGINTETAPLTVEAGANVLVASSFIFRSDDKVRAIRELRESINKE